MFLKKCMHVEAKAWVGLCLEDMCQAPEGPPRWSEQKNDPSRTDRKEEAL